MANFWTEAAREKYNLPPEWEWFKLEAIGPINGPRDIMITGAVAPLKISGKYKGQHDWKKRDKSTEVRCVITEAEHTAFCLRFEAKTGSCFQCKGIGQQVTGWSSTEGTTYRTCTRCGGSGKAKVEPT